MPKIGPEGRSGGLGVGVGGGQPWLEVFVGNKGGLSRFILWCCECVWQLKSPFSSLLSDISDDCVNIAKILTALVGNSANLRYSQ